jgi:hypothetical protein
LTHRGIDTHGRLVAYNRLAPLVCALLGVAGCYCESGATRCNENDVLEQCFAFDWTAVSQCRFGCEEDGESIAQCSPPPPPPNYGSCTGIFDCEYGQHCGEGLCLDGCRSQLDCGTGFVCPHPSGDDECVRGCRSGGMLCLESADCCSGGCYFRTLPDGSREQWGQCQGGGAPPPPPPPPPGCSPSCADDCRTLPTSDGCGGTCPVNCNQTCESGRCVCHPQCPTCRTRAVSDGCGGTCPVNCETTCQSGSCVPDCSDECMLGESQCVSESSYRVCSDSDGDGCAEWSGLRSCGTWELCGMRSCLPCGSDRRLCCHDSTCGGALCRCQNGLYCNDSTCKPDCVGRSCSGDIAAGDCCPGSLCANGFTCCRRAGEGCTAGSQCCSGRCTQGECACTPNGFSNQPHCLTDSDCCSGLCVNYRCACQGRLQACSRNSQCCSGNCSSGLCR